MAITKEEAQKLIDELGLYKSKTIEEIDNLINQLSAMVKDTEASKKEATTENTN